MHLAAASVIIITISHTSSTQMYTHGRRVEKTHSKHKKNYQKIGIAAVHRPTVCVCVYDKQHAKHKPTHRETDYIHSSSAWRK